MIAKEGLSPAAQVELVLGGGGAKGFAHIGFLRAIEECRLQTSAITGVSIGSLAATFYTNGYSPADMERIAFKELPRLDPSKPDSPLRVPGRLRILRGGLMDLHPTFKQIARDYKLSPRENLRILAYNPVTRKPVLFQGTDYDIATALSASCSIPVVMRPVWYGQFESGTKGRFKTILESWQGKRDAGVLVDGGLYDSQPTEFCKSMAIVSRLGMVTKLPSDKLSLFEVSMHWLELFASQFVDRCYPASPDHITVKTGPADVAILSFGVPESKCRAMIEHGYRTTLKTLRRAEKQGRITCGA